jgi:hypothetical protein
VLLLHTLQVWELTTDPRPLFDILPLLPALERFELGLVMPHVTAFFPSTEVWQLPASLTYLDLCLYDATRVVELRGPLPRLVDFYSHALPPDAVAQVLACAPKLSWLMCVNSPTSDALQYTCDDVCPSVRKRTLAPRYSPSDAIERVFADRMHRRAMGDTLREIVSETSWKLGNVDDRTVRHIADTCRLITKLSIYCERLKQSCVAYLIARCAAIKYLHLLCEIPVAETYDEYHRARLGSDIPNSPLYATALRTLELSAHEWVLQTLVAPMLLHFHNPIPGPACNLRLLLHRFPSLYSLSLGEVEKCNCHYGRKETCHTIFVDEPCSWWRH